jgi:hypothetical protein
MVKWKHKLQKWLIHLKRTKTAIIFVKSDVLMAVTMKILYWNATLHSLVYTEARSSERLAI